MCAAREIENSFQMPSWTFWQNPAPKAGCKSQDDTQQHPILKVMAESTNKIEAAYSEAS